ncbi:MAG: hypothetical protein R8J84_00790 [Mariprofundales bacterium]
MIRQIFITLLFFFGPALLVVVIRHLVLLLHLAMKLRHQQHDPEIIDITPKEPGNPPRWFLFCAILIGFACAWLAWWWLADVPAPRMHYVPAHTEHSGKIVPSRMVPVVE